MAPGSGGRSRAGAFQLPVCRRIVPTQRWGRNICRFAHERGSVAVTTCVGAYQPAPVSFRNQSPHADRPFRMAPCVRDFRVQAITDEVTAMRTFFFDMKDGVRPRSPAPNAATVREPAAPTS